MKASARTASVSAISGEYGGGFGMAVYLRFRKKSGLALRAQRCRLGDSLAL
jgi:hypothetical protein